MASSSFSLASHPSKYDVFLNFRGEDTRGNFICHLYDALCRKNILTFYDDDGIKRGDEIAQSLPRAIQDSYVAVLVFSKDYASSSWCLDELAEIIERHRIHRQIVIPVFYNVDPSHLRKHSHDVAAAFVKHEQNPKNAHKIQRWKEALTKAASLSGFDSKNFGDDLMLINKIAEDIFKELNQSMTCDDFGDLVGMKSHIEEIKRVFNIDPCKINILGIWGMGGVGKTTTAKIICDIMSPEFEGRCFIHNVREKAEANLQEELVSKALGEEHSVKNMFSGGLTPFLKRTLGRKKMLVFLDDVNDPLQLDYLIGDPCWFGAGSMILITSRDKQVFGERADFIYKVKPLNCDEALHLFSKSAFGEKHPRDGYESLSHLIVKYAQGNPLALKVLGSALNGKNQEKWKGALSQLLKVQNKDIHKVLQVSYNDLNRVEQDVFLDIACFFKHAAQIDLNKDILRKIYKSNTEFDMDAILSVLVDKCLVTSEYMLEMHDLLQEMGKEIVREEAKYPHKRSRLWDPEDIYEVFVGNKEAEAVESITLDLSKIREMNLNPQVFMKMPNLKFLNFYGKSNLHLSQGFDYLPNTLRYLRWDKYPLESFLPNLQLENLTVLALPNSNIKQIWEGAKEDSVVPQLLYGMLRKIVNSFQRLTSLSLLQNKSIIHLPNGGFAEALEVLVLEGCSSLSTFPEISSNIKKLNLNRTAIKQVPSSSLELLSNLEYLRMSECRELESLPSNFFSKLTSLEELDLKRCSRFKALPEILEPTDNQKYLELDLSETAIEKWPSSINNLFGSIDMSKCWKFVFYPRNFENCFLKHNFQLRQLGLSSCNLRELPEDLSFLSFIEVLDLSKNDFERIPTTFKQLSQLKYLSIDGCKRLLSLPELPSNVISIHARSCRSLKQIWTLKQLPLNSPFEYCTFYFWNCLKLDEDECQEVVNAMLRNYTRTQMQESLAKFTMIYPGSTMPKWVKYQSMGDSIQIHLPSHWFNHLFLGFAFYLCVDSVRESICSDSIIYDCYFGDNYHFSSAEYSETINLRRAEKEQMGVFVRKKFCRWVRMYNIEEGVAFFKFNSTHENEIKTCGVIPLYAQKDEDEFCRTFDFPNLGVSKLKRSATSA